MQRILVCQTGGWIGDMVLLTPALRALKHAYPQSHLTLLLRPRVADLMKTNPYVDACMIDTKATGSFRSLTRLVNQIRERAFHIALVLHPTSFRNALLPFLARVPTRVGSNISGRGILLTGSCVDSTEVHEVHRYLRVLQLLGLNTALPDLEFWHTDTDRQAIQQLLQSEGISPHQPLIGLNLGTTWETKRWAVENFAKVIQHIVRLGTDAKIVLTGSPAEHEFAEALRSSSITINLVGKTTILQLGALLERCKVYLTCDSGPMHIAAAVGTATVSLFGPTDPTRHRPYGTGHAVIEKSVSCRPCYKRTCHRRDAPYLCMKAIDTAKVGKALERKF